MGVYNESSRNYSGLIGGVQTGVSNTIYHLLYPTYLFFSYISYAIYLFLCSYSKAVDLSIMPVYYPLHDAEDEVFDYTPNVFEDVMTIVTLYNITHSTTTMDIIFLYKSVPMLLWIGLLLSLISIISFLHFGMQILYQRNTIEPFWSIFSVFFQQSEMFAEYSSFKSLFLSIISFLISFLTFFYVNYVNNIVGSDLVTIDKAVIVSSYQDILDRDDFVIGLSSYCPEYEKFKNAFKGSVERKLFDKSRNFEVDFDTLNEWKPLIIGQKAALIGRQLVTDRVQKN